MPSLQTVLQDVNSSFERFCLTADSSALEQMLVEEAEELAGPRHRRGDGRCGLRWGRRKARSGFTAARRACGGRGSAAALATKFNCPVATENAALMQALIDNLIERGLDPSVCRLFIVDGAKALSKVSRRAFGAARADPSGLQQRGQGRRATGHPRLRVHVDAGRKGRERVNPWNGYGRRSLCGDRG